MRGNSIGYLIKEGLKSIWVNKLMSFASVGVLSACLFLIGASVIVTININVLVNEVEKENEIVAFVNDFPSDEKESKTTIIENEIKKNSNVSSYVYVSKTEALIKEKEKYGDQAFLLEGFESDNPFPAHFIIKIRDLSKLRITANEIKEINDIYLVNSANDVADTLTTIKNVIQGFGVGTFVILALVSLVIISNTVRLTVFARRREINIMKLVGATNNFIRLPFIIEGFILGTISACVSYFAIWGCYVFVLKNFNFQFPFAQSEITGLVPFFDIAPILLISFLFAGLMTGIFGSSLSMRKHLKV